MKGVRFWSVTALLTVLAFLSFIMGGSGEFIEEPISTEVSVDKPAVFRSQHSSADIIRWRVNGSLISTRNADPDMHVDRDSSGREILRIIPRTVDVYVVVCVAQFDSGSPDVPSAIAYLTVTDNATGFIHEPQPVIVTSGGQAEFRCEHPFAEGYIWKIDGTPWRSLSLEVLQNIQIQESQRLLSVQALPEYNLTSVQCVAKITDIILVDSFTATLTVQGNLDDVKDLKKQNSTLSWSPPFSLDLTNVVPDIVYCVDVYNITCGGRELLISDCDVTETSYTSDVIAPDGYIYEYIVTPRSNVEGAINGTPSQPLRDILPTFTDSSTSLSVGKFRQDTNVRAYQIELTYSSNEPIPSSYSLSLQSLDGLEDMDHVETTATIEPSVLTLEVVSGLPFRRLWNCTILAYGCQENSILNDVLTTHDFRDILSSSLHPGEVRVTGSFTDDSTATGVLVIVIGDSEVIYHKASRDGTDKIKETLITGLAGGEYSISVFVVEENGLPFERVATSPKLVAVETNDVVTPPSSSIEYSLQSTSTGVCITCTFLDSSATDCVAVVHQRISQLSSSGLMNIESSHKLTRSGDTASGCIEGINMEDYHVGVVGGRQINVPVDSHVGCSTTCSVITAALIFIFLLLSFGLLIIVIVKCKRRKQTIQLSKPGAKSTEEGHGIPRYVTPPTGRKRSDLNERTPLITDVSSSVPFTVDTQHQFYLPMVSKLKYLGEAFSLDNGRLVHVSDEPIVPYDMLEIYMAKYDLYHSWKEMESARKKVEEADVPELASPLANNDQPSYTGNASTCSDHIAIDMENSEAISVASDVTETGANDTCEEQSIDGRLSFEVVESHQSGDLDETILTSSESKASTVVSPASTTLQTKDMREQIVRIVTSTPKGSTTESRNLEKSPPPPTFSLSESIDEIEKATAANATPIQVQQQKISDEIIVVHGKQELQVARVHRRLSKTFIEAHENREEEADDRDEEITTTPSVEDKSKGETSKSADSAYISADVSTLNDREISVETEDTTGDDLTRRKDGLKMMNEQLVCPTHLSSKASVDQFTAGNHQLKKCLTSWTPECVGDSTSLYSSSYWPPQQQSSDGDSIVKVAQEGEGPT